MKEMNEFKKMMVIEFLSLAGKYLREMENVDVEEYDVEITELMQNITFELEFEEE